MLPEQLLCTRECSEDSGYTAAQTLPAPGTTVLGPAAPWFISLYWGSACELVLPTTELLGGRGHI